MSLQPVRVKDYDLEFDDNVEKLLRARELSTGGAEIIPEYNLIIWLLLEKTFKAYSDLLSKGPEDDKDEEDEIGSDTVDSKKVRLSPRQNKAEVDESSKAELTLAKDYAEEILRRAGVNVPFDKLKQSEKDNLFKQFSASSKLLLPDGLSSTKSVVDLCQALRNQSKFREEFIVSSFIGKGSYGEVFAAELRKKEPHVFEECYHKFAIKRIPDLSLEKTSQIRDILNESSVLKKLSDHPGIVKFYNSWLALESVTEAAKAYPGSQFDTFNFYLQMELCEETLHQWKTKLIEKGEKPGEKQCIMILKQVSDALQWIHGQNIIHLDINPKNIFWKDKRYDAIKIGDFGLAVEGKSSGYRRGTLPYCAPEENMTEKSDMYSLGVSLFEVAGAISTRVEMYSRLDKWDISTGMETLDGIIPKLLSRNPEERPTAAEINSSLE